MPYQQTGAAGNRALNDSFSVQGRKIDALCIASECMAWRWGVDKPTGVKDDGSAVDFIKTGYCGLAGEP